MLEPWTSSQLLKKKLWFVTGKGGVGKTSIAASLGLFAARHGKNTLLVETHGLNHLGEVFGKGTVGYQPYKIQENLSLLQITPEDALEEYILQQVHFKFIYNAVFNNRYVRHFLDAAPGLIELLTIGKIWYLAEAGHHKLLKKEFDLIIVDAPSTGHGLSLLKIPQIVLDSVRVGPLKNKAESILRFIQDPEKTIIWLTTLAEEMPVNEACEMAQKLAIDVKVCLGPVIMNALWPKLYNDSVSQEFRKTKPPIPMIKIYEDQLSQSRLYLKKLEKRLQDHSIVTLPLIYDPVNELELATELATVIEKRFQNHELKG